jgi:hypothetical protein
MLIKIILLIGIITVISLGLTTNVFALSQNEQLTNNINSQHTLDNKPINNGPPQSSFGYFFTHSR